MLATAKKMEYMSQKVTKAYFYKQLNIRPSHAQEDLKVSLDELKNGLIKLENGVEGKEEKDIMAFLKYTHEELVDILSKPYSKEHGALMIDYGESLLEGAEFISKQHRQKKKNGEETMLVATDNLLFLLERINKLYIAHKAGFKDYNNVIQIQQAVTDFEQGMSKVNAYGRYPGHTEEKVGKINKFWPMAKTFYLGKKGALPKIVLASTDKLVQEVTSLKNYHHQAAVGGKK
ncbi:MAG: hypothetical protein D3923_04565 [Candidatus Electrothrix sp. AR3]|nr:hypothetical protein [Candidatus Electrothrix sp. AR3]